MNKKEIEEWREKLKGISQNGVLYGYNYAELGEDAFEDITDMIISFIAQEKRKDFEEGYNNGYDDCYEGIQRSIFGEQ